MKKKVSACLTVAFMFMTTWPSLAVDTGYKVEGRIVNGDNEGVAFATVVLTSGETAEIAGGGVADGEGRFSASAPAGTYMLTVQYIGYETYSAEITVNGDISLGDIKLSAATAELEQVVVKAPSIVREADRFVMSVAGTAAVIGRNALEMLNQAPGVWVTQDRITLNGQSGVAVMLDERLMTMSMDDLIVYLRSISAEDIQKIEVIPSAGADMDASAMGGMIKITLKKQRRDGIEGSVEMRSEAGRKSYSHTPSMNFNYRQDKLSLYTSFSFTKNKMFNDLSELTDYPDQGIKGNSETYLLHSGRFVSGRIGGIYDIDRRQSVGAEFSVSDSHNSIVTDAVTRMTASEWATIDTSRYDTGNPSRRYAATMNYILKLDTLGSFFKVIADYSTQSSERNSIYDTYTTTYLIPGMIFDSGVRSLSDNIVDNVYGVLSVAADVERRLSDKSRIKAGLKFIHNHMDDDAVYNNFDDASQEWQFDPHRSITQNFTENIGAGYAVFNSRQGKISYVAGLRGEHTYSSPSVTMFDGQGSARSSRHYFSLFPQANVSVPLNEKQTHSLVLAYNRGIGRPSFWSLNPFRMRISEYSYTQGDPNLKPAYSNSLTLSLILAHKYNLTVGTNSTKNTIMQLVTPDEDDPQIIAYRPSNTYRDKSHYINANAPVTVAKWMTLNANLHLQRRTQQIHADSKKESMELLNFNVNSNFTLPANFSIEASYWYQSSRKWGNVSMKPMGNLHAGIKKRFLKDRFTASFNVRNILDHKFRGSIIDPGFSKVVTERNSWYVPQFSFSLRYNFRSGITFKSRNVERSGDDSRM